MNLKINDIVTTPELESAKIVGFGYGNIFAKLDNGKMVPVNKLVTNLKDREAFVIENGPKTRRIIRSYDNIELATKAVKELNSNPVSLCSYSVANLSEAATIYFQNNKRAFNRGNR